MATSEDSLRPTERRKTTTLTASTTPAQISHPTLPFSTRAFRAVKDVVLGKNAQGDGDANGDDELAPAPSQNGAIGGLRKSLSTLEIWKMARPQNGSTRGMGVSGTSSPLRNGTGTSTPTKAKRKTRAQQVDAGDEVEDGSHTPMEMIAQVDGAGSTGKRKRDGTEVQDSLDLEENDEDPIQSATPQKPKRAIRMNASGPGVAKENASRRLPSGDTQRSKRRKLQDILAEEGRGGDREESTTPKTTPAKRRSGRKQLGEQEASKLNKEEAELGFKAIGTPRRAELVVQERVSSTAESDEEDLGTVKSSIGTPSERPGRPPRPRTNGQLANQETAPREVGDPSDEAYTQVSPEEATVSLRKVLESVSAEDIQQYKSQILTGLTGNRRLPLVNLDSEYGKVNQILEQTVLAGEGNSMLLIGSRGAAKTALVETVIADLSTTHGQNFHVIRLNGFIHTDDKLALREIWRQLGKEMEVEDDATTGRTNYADTLSSLLALLSHNAGEEADTAAPSLAKAVIFILDEFDLFASHSRQTLLYNLFDVAQSRNAPIAVLGLTTKIDVVESLEKRVKSRFGQRYVHLSLPRTCAAFSSICKSALIPPPPELPTHIVHTRPKIRKSIASIETLHSEWTTYVNIVFASPTFLTQLRCIYATTKSVPTFLSSCLYPISNLSSTNLPSPELFLSPSASLRPPDSKLHLLPSLSDLALSLLIAAARLDIILSTDLCNFEMAYEEYVNLASRVKMQTSASGQLAVGGGGGRVWGKAVAKGEWERLIALELVLPATGGTLAGKGKGEQGRMWRVDVGLEEIGGSVKMGAVMARWCREI